MFLEVTGPRGEQETLKDNDTRRTNVTRGDGARAAHGGGGAGPGLGMVSGPHLTSHPKERTRRGTGKSEWDPEPGGGRK